ncbi:hypothetical protein OFR22_05365 [Brachyspira hyodysenteriae]|uniref:hypothetical protein n=1 Tax=Brachyspira hyodysenteriae TaxID=159 RepID=UPI0022CE168B|nr:hypothetical protein [Brachyspira hyodysenteriae]MCZ9994805.1 hypothetical protein [Brachyspira hyodysenteriae]
MKEVFSPLNDVLIVYAIKAENNLSILKMMAEEGICPDVVSIGETLKYIKAGGKARECSSFGSCYNRGRNKKINRT